VAVLEKEKEKQRTLGINILLHQVALNQHSNAHHNNGIIIEIRT
jgi:hypothetical protein